MAELKMTKPALLHSEISRVNIDPLVRVAGNRNIGTPRHVLEKPPDRERFGHDPNEVAQHLDADPRGRPTASSREIGAGRAPDHAIESSGGNGETGYIASEDEIGTTHYRKAPLLETATEKIDAREKTQNQL